MVGHGAPLTTAQRDFLMTVARARTETLLRWSFYLRLATGDDEMDWFGHPDLYGHDLPVCRRDVARLVSLGLLARVTETADGFLEEYDVSEAGMTFYRRVVRWERWKRRAPVLALLVVFALLAVVYGWLAGVPPG